MRKVTITALCYAIMPPIGVWTGYALGQENFKLAVPLVVICMTLQFFTTNMWIAAQTEEINRKV